MRTRNKIVVGALVVAAALGFANVALADEDEAASTQSPTQAVDAGLATLETAVGSAQDAANGENRPNGADGVQSEYPLNAGPAFVEGTVGGLIVDGPLR